MKLFFDRADAGRILASRLGKFSRSEPFIVGLPRGGVPVAYEIAKAFDTDMSVVISRKIGLPGQPEFGIGAVSENNTLLLDEQIIKMLEVSLDRVQDIIRMEKAEMTRQINIFRHGRPLTGLRRRTVILVDDGVATGNTAKAAVTAVRKESPSRIVFVFPVCASETERNLKGLVDEEFCYATPAEFQSVGTWYRSFDQLNDGDVIRLMREAEKFGKRNGHLPVPPVV